MLKPTFEAISGNDSDSFLLRRFNEEAFSAPYHYHPELELTLILRGEGRRYVSNNMEAYKPGDLVLLGSNLPHCWKSENTEPGENCASSIVVQFKDNFLGSDFLSKPEFDRIAGMFLNSNYGIHFTNETALEAGEELQKLVEQGDPFLRLIALLNLLQLLSLSKQYVLLDKQPIQAIKSGVERERINAVLAYIVDNFKTEVNLDKAADVARMSVPAFCKYFKKITRKTFIETVNEYRIAFAIQSLIQTDKPISEISFLSGFCDVSHFYKTFKSKRGMSPMNYRKKFMDYGT